MFIDSHAHLNFPQFDNDLDETIRRAKEASVLNIINVGSDIESSKKAIGLAKKYENLYATVGIHPTDKKIFANDELYQKLKDLAQEPKVVAVGECGLDYFRMDSSDENERERQKGLFEMQIRLAQELNLPLIIHSRDSANDTLAILENFNLNGLAGVAHCFSYDLETAQEFMKLGFFIGITAIITYPGAEDLRGVVKELPLEKILIETDCQYLAPQNHRGERNEPAYVTEVARKIAETKNISLEEVENQTTQNAQTLFKI